MLISQFSKHGQESDGATQCHHKHIRNQVSITDQTKIVPSYLVLSAGLDLSRLFKLHKAFQFKKNIKCKDK